jgi:preprotein translocase subunit YajC
VVGAFLPDRSGRSKKAMSFILLQSAPSNPLLQFGPILLIFVIFYFLLFMPMQRQKKQQQKMLSELKSGDVVLTNGGIMGTIVAINEDDSIIVRVKPDGVKLQMARGAVASLVKPETKS